MLVTDVTNSIPSDNSINVIKWDNVDSFKRGGLCYYLCNSLLLGQNNSSNDTDYVSACDPMLVILMLLLMPIRFMSIASVSLATSTPMLQYWFHIELYRFI